MSFLRRSVDNLTHSRPPETLVSLIGMIPQAAARYVKMV